jgi:hypothetical protein
LINPINEPGLVAETLTKRSKTTGSGGEGVEVGSDIGNTFFKSSTLRLILSLSLDLQPKAELNVPKLRAQVKKEWRWGATLTILSLNLPPLD